MTPLGRRLAGRLGIPAKSSMPCRASLRLLVKSKRDIALTQLRNRRPARQHGVWAAGVVRVLLLDVDAQVGVYRGQHVLRRLGVAARKGAAGVGGADDAAAANRAAGQGGAEDVGIMVAARLGVDPR